MKLAFTEDEFIIFFQVPSCYKNSHYTVAEQQQQVKPEN